jgi:hypothetical protein
MKFGRAVSAGVGISVKGFSRFVTLVRREAGEIAGGFGLLAESGA